MSVKTSPTDAILGAVLAGGRSSRFGSDKAKAQLDGATLLDRAIAFLDERCASVILVGRSEGPVDCVADWPKQGMGPLAGVASALREARARGFAQVLTIGIDAPDLPGNLHDRFDPAPSYLETQPVIGLWRSESFEIADAILRTEGRHSMYGFAEAVGARAVRLADPPSNINRPDDLEALRRRREPPG